MKKADIALISLKCFCLNSKGVTQLPRIDKLDRIDKGEIFEKFVGQNLVAMLEKKGVLTRVKNIFV